MKLFRIVLVLLVSLSALVGAVLFLIGYLRPKPGGIKVETNPAASVYINGVLAGKTPFEGVYQPGIVSLKLVPNESNQNLVPFEINITIVSGIQTVVGREFGKSEDESSDYVISFDKTSGSDASLIVVSRPEDARVSIDGVPQGFAPYKISVISPALHQVIVEAPGYAERVTSIKTFVGYRLTFYVKLEKNNSIDVTPAGSTSISQPVSLKTFVQIMNTPTGFLRVRTKPGPEGTEIAEVKPGDTYLYIGEDTTKGWLEIQYLGPQPNLPSGVTGWVSGDFAKKITLPTGSTSSASLK